MIINLRQYIRILYPLLLISGLILISGQKANDLLDKKITENGNLFKQNLDKAYKNIDQLIKESKAAGNHKAELILIDRKCRYFYSKNQIDDLILNAEELDKKSVEFLDIYFQAMANIYLAEAFSINGLYDRALKYLDKAYTILKSDQTGQKKIFLAKANVLNSYANVYSDKGEPKKAVQKLREVIKSYSELGNDREIDQFQYVNYSNIASIYIEYNADSARYFAQKSIALRPQKGNDDSVMMMNYFLLGQAYKQSGNTKEAIIYFQKAITISNKTGMELNKKLVYTALQELYKKNGTKDSAIIYENKLKQMEISILESKYNSLKNVVAQDQKINSDSSKWLYLLGFLVIPLVLSIYILKKNRSKQVYKSPTESFSLLTELAKNNDPAFMLTFEQIFPSFSEKLLKIDPELQKSEIEFCALLRLNLSTKEIAKSTFIETKTVQNKKYRIRKKLNIPPNIDIYNWFSSLD